MRIREENVTVFMGNGENNQNVQGKNKSEEKTEQKNNIFAGNLKLPESDIDAKRKEAQKRALQVVKDAFEGDKSIDKSVEEIRQQIRDMQAGINESMKQVDKFEQQKTELKEMYGIREDSQEQKDLELLEKRRDFFKPGSGVSLSEDDMTRLAQIDKMGLTDYQERSLKIDSYKEPFEKAITENREAIKQMNASITSIKLERLKTDPMAKATKESEAIKKAASEEIVGMLMQEAKEHIDKEYQEKIEEEAKKTEEKEEKEEQLEALKEKLEEMEELVEDNVENNEENSEKVEISDPTDQMVQIDKTKSEVQQEIERIMEEMKLLMEDLKGSAVDRSL